VTLPGQPSWCRRCLLTRVTWRCDGRHIDAQLLLMALALWQQQLHKASSCYHSSHDCGFTE
jgi:hypothetical protein